MESDNLFFEMYFFSFFWRRQWDLDCVYTITAFGKWQFFLYAYIVLIVAAAALPNATFYTMII